MADTKERITVNLTARASRALDEVSGLTGDNKTDSICRALSVYAYVEKVLRSGGNLIIQEPGSEPRQLVIF